MDFGPLPDLWQRLHACEASRDMLLHRVCQNNAMAAATARALRDSELPESEKLKILAVMLARDVAELEKRLLEMRLRQIPPIVLVGGIDLCSDRDTPPAAGSPASSLNPEP